MTIPETAPLESVPSIPFDDPNVRVAVRARPLVEKEINDKCQECVSYSADGREIVLGKDRRFTFDHVFGPSAAQEEVYTVCVKPLVESSVSGYNATVIAYGQTGSGKTHTMGSAINSTSVDEDLGILPRAIRQLYESIDERKGQATFDVKCSFVEIYNEEIKDLLHPETPSKSISIREDANGDIILAGVKDEAVSTYDDMMRCLEQGSSFRTTGSTLMNQQSSRSHAIFTISIEQHSVQSRDGHEIISAKFHLVDLAGSERAKRTGAVGMRFKESVTINCGLLALGNVISALGDERKRGQHVPYRESKLTRILQDSLGGNSKTCMIACISTADVNFEETLNTVKYANRARNIQNKPIINRDAHSVQLSQLRAEVKLLQEELVKAKTQGTGDEMSQEVSELRSKGDVPTAELQMLRQKSLKVEQEFLQLKQESEASKLLLKKLEKETFELRSESNLHQVKLEEVCREMNCLVQKIPQWESCKEITTTVRIYLLEMMRRIVSVIDRGSDVSQSPSTVITPLVKELVNKLDAKIETESEICEEMTSVVKDSNQYVDTIRLLEEKLADKEKEVVAKSNELLEAKQDLARDDHIFTEKMKEMQALKKLARDLKKEKEELLLKSDADASIIARLTEQAMSKENEITAVPAELSFPNAHEDIKLMDETTMRDLDDLPPPIDTDKTLHEVVDALQKMNASEMQELDSNRLHKVIETQILELQSEIKKKEEEAKQVRKEIEALDKGSAIGRNGKKQLHEELEQNLKRLTLHLKALKKQRWQLESQHLEQQKSKADEKVQHLQQQVSRMRTQQDCLKKKIKETTEKFDERHDVKENGQNMMTKHENEDEHKQLNYITTVEGEESSSSEERNQIYLQGGETLLSNLEEIFSAFKQHDEKLQDSDETISDKNNNIQNEDYMKNINQNLRVKLHRVISSWYAEKQAMEQALQSQQARVNKHEKLERDHKALKEELENTKSLMHKAGLGIRLSSRNVRELSDGNVEYVELRCSDSTTPPSRGSPSLHISSSTNNNSIS